MVDKPQGEWVLPNPQIPRSFGMMNLIFGILLLLFGLGSLAMYAISPMLTKYIMANAQQQMAAQKAVRETKIADLKKQEDTAKTKEEKEGFQSEREMLEKQVEPDFGAMQELTSFNIFSDMRLAIFTITEQGLGLILNILMIISGAGLLGFAEWARKMAVWVSWAKIARWISIVVFTLLVVMPITAERTEKLLTKMQQQAQARGGGAAASPVPMLNLTQLSTVAGAVTTIFSAAIAMVYPIVSIWFLTRPPAQAACLAKSRLAPRGPGRAPGELL